MGGMGVIFLNFLLRVSFKGNMSIRPLMNVHKANLQDRNIAVKENSKVGLDSSVLQRLAPVQM